MNSERIAREDLRKKISALLQEHANSYSLALYPEPEFLKQATMRGDVHLTVTSLSFKIFEPDNFH